MNYLKLFISLVGILILNTSFAKLERHTRSICEDEHCYYINQGVVFKGDNYPGIKTIRGEAIPRSQNVKSIILHRGVLVALQTDGDVFAWKTGREGESMWVKIGRNGKKLYSDGSSLYMVTDDGELFIHDNRLNIGWTTYTFEGTVASIAEDVFYNTDLEGVKRLREEDGKIIVGRKYVLETDLYGFSLPNKTSMGACHLRSLSDEYGDRSEDENTYITTNEGVIKSSNVQVK